MVGHGGSSAGSYLADPTSPIPSHCASIVATSTVRVNILQGCGCELIPEQDSVLVSVHELLVSQFDLEVYYSERLPDAPMR